ncbi:ZIP family metal transporter [Mycoplasma sp. Ms02]|uniref:ZIP family metal transporter n=1 Tax=Mycoplasma sp. Ms02 TaxID=353851 RepID=UPI001C8AECE2|nr:ZIP family metal transporter [Mycoplasma sp. Ms02]QZE12511.1 ZIP family metal transporter [Mycoplasma sp. Ms02]
MRDFLESTRNIIGEDLTKLLLVLVTLAILLFIPILVSSILPFFRHKIKPRFKVYLYAFITGFFIVISLFGFMREALEISSVNAQSKGYSQNWIYLSNISTVALGALVGILFSFVVKFVISYRLNKKLIRSKKMSAFYHSHDADGLEHAHTHEHPDFIFNRNDTIDVSSQELIAQNTKDRARVSIESKVESKLKVVALLLLLTHRIPEGLILGYNLNLFLENKETNLSTAFFVSLVLHLIPEEIVFYYRLREAGYKPWKSLLLSTGALLLFFPFMMIGIYSGNYIEGLWYIKASVYSFIGGIFLFTSLVEFFPEFYHTHFNHKRNWFFILLCLFAGIIFSIFIMSFHLHGKI